VAGPGAAHAAVVLNSDQQPAGAVVAPVSQTDDRFDKLPIPQGSGCLAFELYGEGFAAGDEGLEAFWRQESRPPYGARCSRICMGWVMAFNSSQ